MTEDLHKNCIDKKRIMKALQNLVDANLTSGKDAMNILIEDLELEDL